jgi:molecular chaperone GrpE
MSNENRDQYAADIFEAGAASVPPGGSGESSPRTEPTQAETKNQDELMTQLQGDLERFRDLALRSQADFENFRKRAAREKDDAVKYANASLLERLIPILDNFELGLSAARVSSEGSAILSGMEMVARQLNDFLQQHGVEPVNAEGQKFDPNIHEAVGHEPSADVPEGSIVRQLRRGFKLRERLLRPATVVVSRGQG